MPHTQRQQVCSRGQCSSRLLPLLLLLLSLAAQPSQAAIHIPSNYHISDLKRPPMIITHPESVTVFSVEDLVMSCEASGNPLPIFRWTKDGEEFDPGSDPELKVSERPGSFAFYTLSNSMDNLKQYQAKYVCYASNELGTAVSNEATLTTDGKNTLTVNVKSEEGNSIVLKCNPPQSSMEPIIHWMDWRLHHIQLSERVVVGKDGNLYFAHLTTEDNRNDYTCNVQYLATRTILAKEPITLTVNPSNSVLRNRRPHMMKPTGSHSTYHALRGQTVELECIVQGLPTPQVSWLKKDGEKSESRAIEEMFNRRLRISNISESDGGEYQCIAENSQGKASHTYTVAVEAAPYWIKEPPSQLYAPGETVRLDCLADGIPSPTISWTINGIPLSATDKDSRRSLTASGSLILKDVNFGDTAIYQCQASNKHGTILINTNVYVIELPPQILTEDGNTYTVPEGKKALLECETFGSPKPKLVSSLCVCLLSPDRTVILSPPQDLKVQRGNTTIFTCLALVDPKLGSPQIQWRKNDKKIFDSHKITDRMIIIYFCLFSCFKPNQEHTLYSLHLFSPCSSVHLYCSCYMNKLTYHGESSKERGWEELKRVMGNKERASLPLWPYMSYRFRVIAINYVGKSDPSRPSEIHNTPAEAPDNNPKDVRSVSEDPDTLVITWEEMDKRNFNGPDFKYRVFWRRVVGSGPNWHTNYTTTSPFTVNDIGNFSAFEIKVQAVNGKGDGPEPDPGIGYSGENVPLEAPTNVGVELMNSTTIKVNWRPVDKETVRGHLLGYKTGPSEEKKVISDLRPYSHYALAVAVFNSKGEGPRSETMPFKTDEGVPGPPMSLMLDSPSETEMTLHWTPPGHPNGVLIGYLLQYQQSEHRLHPYHYRFFVRGRTAAGDGEPIMREGATTLDGECIMLCFFCFRFFSLFYLVSPTSFILSTPLVLSSCFYIIKTLVFSPPSSFPSEGVTEVQPSFATQGWFIGVVSAIVLLLLILLILCFIKRSKGGKYSVKDKEEGPMDSEARPMKDETFGEYSDLEEKRTASLPSLGEESKLCSEDNLDFNGSSAITTELNMDESLVSQFSRPSEGPEALHGLPDNSLLNPTNGMSNSVTILD
uniref:L1 cell adhesion molecule, paralog a n=1 Tax=Sander lucioperca TaxID=283035 RepID=A0A8C9Y6E5_SANLU